MFYPGDVIRLWSDEANKPKYHICIHPNGRFLFLNSPKKKAFAGDFSFPCKEIDFLEATPEGYSIISCSLVVTLTEREQRKAKKLGTVEAKLLIRLIAFVERTPVLSDEEKEIIVEGLADWA